MANKKYTPLEAAIAVLKKAEELYKASILSKAKVDEGLSPQKKASQRAERNNRSYSLSDKTAPKSTLPRHNKFYEKEGALAGKPGEKVSGKPAGSHTATGVHAGSPHDKNLQGRSAAGINAEWSKKHSHAGHAEYARKKAVAGHTKKLNELKNMPKPDLGKAESAASPSPSPSPSPAAEEYDPYSDPGIVNKSQEAPMKGHIKLAKFVGRMEAKREKPVDKAETGHEKGVHAQAGPRTPGMSEAGMYNSASKVSPNESRPAVLQNVESYKNSTKGAHKEVLGQMKRMPKPKLPG